MDFFENSVLQFAPVEVKFEDAAQADTAVERFVNRVRQQYTVFRFS